MSIATIENKINLYFHPKQQRIVTCRPDSLLVEVVQPTALASGKHSYGMVAVAVPSVDHPVHFPLHRSVSFRRQSFHAIALAGCHRYCPVSDIYVLRPMRTRCVHELRPAVPVPIFPHVNHRLDEHILDRAINVALLPVKYIYEVNKRE